MTTAPGTDAATAYLSADLKMLIGEDWRAASSRQTFEAIDPGTGRVIASVPEADVTDVNAAVSAARGAFTDRRWRGKAPAERAAIMLKVADLIESNIDELAYLETLNFGQPYAKVRGLVTNAVKCFRHYAGWCDKLHGLSGTFPAAGRDVLAYTLKEPIGVVACIVPWNSPLGMAAGKLAPALAAGCAVVLKPAEETPITALRLGDLMLAAGVPPGVVNVITGFGGAGAALAAHPDVDKLTFTGSTAVGRLIVHAAADSNLKKVDLELGGKSPVIIMPDADLREAIPGAANAIFSNAGQACSAGSRLLVHEAVYDLVVAGIAERAGKIRLGYGFDAEAEMGPVISDRQRASILDYIASGRRDGAEIVAGGKPVGEVGFYVEPTILAHQDNSLRVAREEIFGPVLCIQKFSELEDAISIANSTSYGLAASIWSRDISTAHRIAAEIRAGKICLNGHYLRDYTMPTGGYKESGWGREHGPNGMDLYLEEKVVFTMLR
jgi:phenylacetaldehyde dehydrogenase